MPNQVKASFPLDEITHSVRATQAVLQYGVGAMVDFPDQTLVTAAPEFWPSTKYIYDDRFARALGVDYFKEPINIAYARFPEWYFCPKCRKFQSLSKWIEEYSKYGNNRIVSKDKYMVYNMQCPRCHQDLVVARIVTICEKGHLNDFPWVEWVHIKSNRSICSNPSLKFKTGASGTEGLEGLSISCSCGATTTLKDAFDPDCFEKLDKELCTDIFKCPGNHPFNGTHEECECYPRTVQRGASSVYFPLIYSSLVIPPYADKLNESVENSEYFKAWVKAIKIDQDAIKNISIWADRIANDIRANSSDVEKVLLEKIENKNNITDIESTNYKFEEYNALTGLSETSSDDLLGDFSREEMNISEYDIPYLKSIVLIDKIRVVHSLVGFSRISPKKSKNDPDVVDIKENNTNWYPAYEVRGEGIFIEINQEDIDAWIESCPEVRERADILAAKYKESYLGENNPKTITPKFIMLHTLSHLLITQLSFECGYSIASLSERIYCSDQDDGKIMSGIFIYTASGDSEGTLGGLVRQGRPDTFPKILKKALFKALNCSNDPVCITSKGQGRDSLNLAACYACALLPETCCEEQNVFLDRGMIVGTYDNEDIGFWRNMIPHD